MVKEVINKADYQPVTIISAQKSKLMFKTEEIEVPVYKKDKKGDTVVDKDGNPVVDHYEEQYGALVEYFTGKRTEAAMRKLIADWYDLETDQKILNGFVWTVLHGEHEGEQVNVWLSTENQFNFKAAYDLAVQTKGESLPVTFKLGEQNGASVYHTFEELTEFTDFYTKAVAYINQTLAEGWQKKDGFDWSLYVDTE